MSSPDLSVTAWPFLSQWGHSKNVSYQNIPLQPTHWYSNDVCHIPLWGTLIVKWCCHILQDNHWDKSYNLFWQNVSVPVGLIHQIGPRVTEVTQGSIWLNDDNSHIPECQKNVLVPHFLSLNYGHNKACVRKLMTPPALFPRRNGRNKAVVTCL